MEDLFAASPFAEEYPLSREQVHRAAQQAGPSIWSSDMDHQLSLFVRKYCFDFAKASKALRSYVQHVLVEMDDVDIDSEAFTEDACRRRWSLLDMTEFERRRGIARELMTMREVIETKMSNPTTPQTAARHFGEASASATPPSASRIDRGSLASTPSRLAPETVRVGASLGPEAHRMPASPVLPQEAGVAGVRGSRQSRAPPAPTPATNTPAVVRTDERREAWAAAASPALPEAHAPPIVSASRPKTAGNDEEDSDSSDEIEVIDPSELRRRSMKGSLAGSAPPSTALMPPPSSSKGEAKEVNESERALAAPAVPRPGTAPSKAVFEKSVYDEQLERSDFTIFTHDLKKTCDGFYNAVRANLPSIAVEEVTDDEDDEVAPVFSNLQLNDKGEYVGRLKVGPLLTEPPPSSPAAPAAPPTQPAHPLHPAAASSPAGPPAAYPVSVVAPAVEPESASSDEDGEVEEVVDSADLRRRAMAMGTHPNPSPPRSAATTTPSPTRVPPPAPVPQAAPEPVSQQVLLEKDLKILKQAEADLHNAMLGRGARKDAAPPLSAARDPAELAALDQKMAEAARNNSFINVEIEAAKGLSLVAKGEHATAVGCLSAAIEGAGLVAPKDGAPLPAQKPTVAVDDAVKWLVARGKCYLEIGECYNAVPDLERAVALDDASVEARLQYAIALRFSCKYVEASEQIKHLLRLDPEHRYGRLEERRLQQRLAHAQGQDLDTWRRKDSVIATAKEIQARAEKSIEESRSKVESLNHKKKEKELEEAFFRQIAQAKEKQAAERERMTEVSQDAILDVNLGGIDVDDLLRELHEMQPDPNVFASMSPRAGEAGGEGGEGEEAKAAQALPTLPPLLQALVSSGSMPESPAPAAAAADIEEDAALEAAPARAAAEPDARPPPTPLEIGAGARAVMSNVSGLFEAADSVEALVRKPAAATHPRIAAAPPAHRAPVAVAAVGSAEAGATQPGDKGEQTSGPPIEKGSIGAKLRALREGRMAPPMPPAAAALPIASDHGKPPESKPATSVPRDVVIEASSGGQGGGRGTAKPRQDPATMEPPKAAPTEQQRREMAQQLRAKGRIAMAGSDDEDEDSEEEEDLMALRSQLKAQSKKLSPEEQEAQERKAAARKFLEERARQDREEQEQRRMEEAERKKAEAARQKQLDDLAASSARKRREMDREREEKERADREKAQEEVRRRHAQAAEEEAALEEEEEALLKEKARAAAARVRSVAPASSGGAAPPAAKQAGAPACAASAVSEIEEEDADDAEETLMQERLKEAQRLREERLSAAASRHKRMMDLSKGPMAALPGGLFLELSQREALEVVPAAVEDLCVLLLPDLDMRLLAGVLHWMVAPGSLATALDHANVAPADRDDYGDVAAAPAAAAGGVAPKVFPFQVVGLARGTLAKDLCMSTLLPSATQKRQGETGLPEPVVMLALAPPTSASVNGAAGAPDLAKSVKALLASVSLDQLYLGDKSSAPTHDGYSGAPLSTSLDAVASVISGKSAVTPALKSPLFWFVCAPAVVDGGDMAGTSSADVSSDDPVVSVLRPEAVGKRALGPILVRLAEENIDLTSIRMLFPSAEHYERSRSFTTAVVAGGYPIIVVGSRGHKAVQRWSEAVGPEDPFVAKRTDPATLRAKYGVDRKRNLMSCSRSAERNRRESQWYFSLSHDVELDEDTCAAVLPPIPMMVPYPVIATTLVLRAGVPGSFVAKVVSCCLQNGFRLSAFRRSTLEPSVSRHVGLPAWINIRGTTPPPVCLQLTAENAVARLIRLGPMLSRMAEESGVVSQVEDTCTLTPPPKQPSHRAAGAKEVFETFVNVLAIARTLEGAQRCGVHLDLNQGPECVDRVRSSSRLADMPSRFAVNKELPQAVCVVITPDAVTDAVAMSHIFEALFINTNAELLGAKLLTWLPEHVSAEMCPFPKDHYMRDDFLEHMEAGPAFVIAMRMVDGLERILDIVGPLPGTGALAMLEGKEATRRGGPASPAQTLRAKFAVDGVRCAVVPSSDAKHALRLMACIFEEDELSWPPSAHGAGAMVPPPASDDVIEALKAEADGPPVLHTVALVKPDARHNFAKILKYVRRGEFKIVGAKMLAPSQEEGRVLTGTPQPSPSPSSSTSTSSPASPGSPPKSPSAGGLAGRPCIALLLERHNAVAAWLKLCGDADPQKAKRENEFALRAIFGTSLSTVALVATKNALHASASYAAAVAEAALLFPEVGAGGKLAPGDAICGGARRQMALGGGGKSLKEVVLVVLCEKVLEEEEHYNVVDSLMREDFRLVNLRQTWLSTKQATELAGALGHRALEDEGRKGPCLLLAMERDSGISRLQIAFNNRSSGGLGATIAKFKQHIFFSEATSRANAAVPYCFDSLWDSAYKIQPAK